MNTLLEKHVAGQRQAREDAGQLAFEQKYPDVLPYLEASDVRYIVEQQPVSASGGLLLRMFRWNNGYLYDRRWPLRPDGAVEYKHMSVGSEVLAELVLEEVSNWDKWAAAQAWKEKNLVWLGLKGLLKLAIISLTLLAFLIQAEVSTCLFVVALLPAYLVISLSLHINQRRRFPDGMVPRPDHILHHSKITDAGGPVTFSSSNGQYSR